MTVHYQSAATTPDLSKTERQKLTCTCTFISCVSRQRKVLGHPDGVALDINAQEQAEDHSLNSIQLTAIAYKKFKN